MDVWVLFPSANITRAKRCMKRWRERGYKVGVFFDEPTTIQADVVVTGEYKGYYNAINQLCRAIPNGPPDVLVAIGDDMSPDPDNSAKEIARQFYAKFPDGFGIMQPMGDVTQKDKQLAGSPWIGKGWIERAYRGNGPLPDFYKHFYGDQELWEVANIFGVLWPRDDLTHAHHHWSAPGGPAKTDYQKKHSKEDWKSDKAIFEERQSEGFPTSKAVASEKQNTEALMKVLSRAVRTMKHSIQSNIMLQYCNVWWRGGSTLFTLDIARAFPEFHHIVCYRSDHAVDNYIVQEAKLMGVELYHLQKMTPATIKALTPAITILHNPGKESLEGAWPFEWIREYPVITFHHSPVYPWIPTDVHLFVSDYLKSKYDNLLSRMECWGLVPPCIETERFEAKREYEAPVTRFGMVLSWDKGKFSDSMIEKTIEFVKQNGSASTLTIIGGAGRIQSDDARIIIKDTSTNLATELPALDCLIYFAEVPDTWGRVVTEGLASGNYIIARNIGAMPEQVTDPYIGQLVDTVDEIPEAMQKFVELREHHIDWRTKAKFQAHRLAGYDVLRSKLSKYLFMLRDGKEQFNVL